MYLSHNQNAPITPSKYTYDTIKLYLLNHQNVQIVTSKCTYHTTKSDLLQQLQKLPITPSKRTYYTTKMHISHHHHVSLTPSARNRAFLKLYLAKIFGTVRNVFIVLVPPKAVIVGWRRGDDAVAANARKNLLDWQQFWFWQFALQAKSIQRLRRREGVIEKNSAKARRNDVEKWHKDVSKTTKNVENGRRNIENVEKRRIKSKKTINVK